MMPKARDRFCAMATGMLRALALAGCVHTAAATPASPAAWSFLVAGDSRNCGDVVMPSIAAAAQRASAQFYWHLGDLRAIYDIDEDFRQLHPRTSVLEYESTAWDDFIHHQVEPFGELPFFVAIGNHETITPKSRDQFVLAFADWLDSGTIREQRLADDPHDHALRTWYHWMRDGVDFISLDNATPEQFDAAQLRWLKSLLARDRASPRVRAVVVGMHEALPDSVANAHSMGDSAAGTVTGRGVYQALLDLRAAKPVYVLASHSHFVMDRIFDTPYLRDHGGVLPGWIIGTAGAVRYPLPADAAGGRLARSGVYGYLAATVSPAGGNDADPIHFEFHEVTEADVPATVTREFGASLVHSCYAENPPHAEVHP